MTALTQQQREAEWVEKAVLALCRHRNPELFKYGFDGLPTDGSATLKEMALMRAWAEAALAAVLPVIREAALEEAIALCEGYFMEGFGFNCERWDRESAYGQGRTDAADLLRALAKEAGV